MTLPDGPPASIRTEPALSTSSGAAHEPRMRPVTIRYDPEVDVPPTVLEMRKTLKRWSRSTRRTLTSDKFAVANVVMFMITAAIFLPAITVLVIYLQDVGENQPQTTAGLHSRGVLALDQLTRSQGMLESRSTAWEADTNPHQLLEIGLLSSNGFALDANKIEALQSGGLQADASNGYLDYPELKNALNMNGYDFYIRIYPIITSSIADPYATDPIKGKHVAYIANLTNPATYDGNDADTWDHKVDVVNHDFDYVSTTASREIDALTALSLTTSATDDTNGFSATWYQPHTTNAALYLANPYVNTGEISGDIIADTDRVYDPDGLLGDPATPYIDHFLSYMEPTSGNFLYDAIIFGTDVHLDRWNTTAVQTKLTNFLNAGGVVIFLGTDTYSKQFVTNCNGNSDCLLGSGSTLQPLTIPDSSNPIVTEPNGLDHRNYARKGSPEDHWVVCGVEKQGFLPVVLDSSYDPNQAQNYSCDGGLSGQPVVLGVTASDRFTNNGVVILTSYDVTEGQTNRVTEGSRFFSNLLNYALLRGAYLSYGPTLPDGAPVESAARTMLVLTDQNDLVDVRITLFVWRS